MTETDATVGRDGRGWSGHVRHATPTGAVGYERGYFATLDELDAAMRAALAQHPDALAQWEAVVARSRS